MDMDILSAVMLTAIGLVILWFVMLRKQRLYSDVTRSSQIKDCPISTSGGGWHKKRKNGKFSKQEEDSADDSEVLLYPHGIAWTKGRRAYMEDRHVACAVDIPVGPENARKNKAATLYGVFDGHGGSRAAEFCETNMRPLFRRACRQDVAINANRESPEERTDGEIASAILHRAMCELDTEFLKIANAHNFPDGTTAVVALAHGDQLVVGNIGDSRAVLVTANDDVIPLSEDHKPDRVDERQRIEQRNGFIALKGVYRVMGILAVSRAIGDMHLKTWVPGVPEMKEELSLRRIHARYLVIASDGLWDVLKSQDVPAVVVGIPTLPGGALDTVEMARVLTAEACRRHSMDNITVVVVDLQDRDDE